MAVPVTRSTWKKQSGRSTVRVYGPPEAKVAEASSKSVWGSENVAAGAS